MKTRSWISFIRPELRGARRIVVLGVGNPARGDDGAGLACIRDLRRTRPRLPSFVRLVEAGSVPENFTGRVRVFGPSHVIVVDAARAGRRPGAIFVVQPSRIAHEDVSSHRVPLSWLARYLAETIGCRVLIIGIQPGRTEPGRPLSVAVGKSVERVTAGLARIFKTIRAEANRDREPASRRKRPVPVRSSSA